MAKKNASIHQVSLNVFPLVISSEFRMRQYRDDDHHEDAPHFMWISDYYRLLLGYKFSGVVDPVTGKKDIICKNKKENCGAAQCQCDRQLAFQLAEAEITWNPNMQGLYFVIKVDFGYDR